MSLFCSAGMKVTVYSNPFQAREQDIHLDFFNCTLLIVVEAISVLFSIPSLKHYNLKHYNNIYIYYKRTERGCETQRRNRRGWWWYRNK